MATLGSQAVCALPEEGYHTASVPSRRLQGWCNAGGWGISLRMTIGLFVCFDLLKRRSSRGCFQPGSLAHTVPTLSMLLLIEHYFIM